jgi:hypothetical protein
MVNRTLCILLLTLPCKAAWRVQENPLTTPWTAKVSPGNTWPEYPRPQLVRPQWINLNGLWDYAITAHDAGSPTTWDGQILVPFCVESALSGVKKTVGAERALWYRRHLKIRRVEGRRTLLHFGAVDWHARVWVNGQLMGEHRGGYTPFSFDITDALTRGRQTLTVRVWDPTDQGTQPRGKQVRAPEGIWYTSVTGIWQTVWLEQVPEVHIAGLKVVPDIHAACFHITVTSNTPPSDLVVTVTARKDDQQVGTVVGFAGQLLHLRIRDPKLWSPDSPHLYDLRIKLTQAGKVRDEVTSYAALRQIGIQPDARGTLQLVLNDRRRFHLGPLDQGWWPDGLYTAPTDEALQYDLKVTKDLGFNTLRKHVKVEPARFYYHCDRLGLMVWQDMPNGNLRRTEPDNLKIGYFDADAQRPADSAIQFERELTELIQTFSHFPCIVMWVPFNEGWGQYQTQSILQQVRDLDPTRLVNLTSGWSDRGLGDVEDVHEYPGPGMEPAEEHRAAVLGEFGGLGWPVPGHLWWNKRNWGYRNYTSRAQLNENYLRIVGNLHGPIGFGLAAAIYTQTTDVEGEVNGLMTYDRKVIKLNANQLQPLHRGLLQAHPQARVLLATSEQTPQIWRYRQETPKGPWMNPDYDDSAWGQGPGAFQTGKDICFHTGTLWTQGPLYLRRHFTLDTRPDNLWLQFYQNTSDTQIYLNGRRISHWQDERVNRRHYRHHNLSEHADLLQKGDNVLAIVADKEKGPRGIDVGLYVLQTVP